jgi:ubiquinone/menaquinone biosynthesis C-methylase UbiE
MEQADSLRTVSDYWGREGLGQTILDALVAAGKRLDALTIEDLAPVDQLHSGGMVATTELAQVAEIAPRARLLDVGGGLGGPARTLAARFGCKVTVIDLTESYVRAAEILTERIGLGDQVEHYVGNGLELPFDDGAFDVVWTQQSCMNIRDKERLYEGFYRVLVPGGTLAFQEFMAGPVQPPIFPVMWARDGATSFLRTPSEMRNLIESVGFRARVWTEVTAETAPPSAPGQAQSITELLMGDDLPAIRLAGKRNEDEGRVLRVRAVFERL